MTMIHLTARTLPWRISLLDDRVASWLWRKLRRAFPSTLAACLMPRHLHLVDEVEDPEAARARLRRTLAWHTRLFGPPDVFRVWEPVPEPALIVGPQKLARQVRYVVLNPCRAGYVADPIEWIWSTHRDVVGGVASPWVHASRLAAALGHDDRGFVTSHHRYVSSDPSTSPTGTPAPEPHPPERFARHPLLTISRAAVVAARGDERDLERRRFPRNLFLGLAVRNGWRDAKELAAHCGITPRAVRYSVAAPPPSRALAAASLCLGDERLLATPTFPRGPGPR